MAFDLHLALYRDLHRNPEPSGQERRTAARFAAALRGAGLKVSTGVGGHGVVGVLANGPGPVVLLRAELDALPVLEETGLEYASTARVDGRPMMHACGHDLHLAAAVATAEKLAGLAARSPSPWHGTLLVVGQPAEERLTGAAAMLANGLYTRWPRPDVALAQHVAPLPAGLLGHMTDVVTAGSAAYDVRIFGRGGHAGMPHLAVNPITVAGRIAAELGTGLGTGAVVTVGALHAGTAANAVPDVAELSLSIRSLSESGLKTAVETVERLVRDRCTEAGCPRPPELRRTSSSPVQRNNPEAAARVRAAHEAAFGARRVLTLPPSMATEDFPLLADPAANPLDTSPTPVPTVYWMTGGVGPQRWSAAPGTTAAEKLAALPTNHSPHFAPDPHAALPPAAGALAVAALAFLQQSVSGLQAEPTAPSGLLDSKDATGRVPAPEPLEES